MINIIELKNVSKTFSAKSGDVEAVSGVTLTIEKGDIYGVIGLSGAGKSTLVRCINLLERPTSGQILFDGVDLPALKPRQLREKRRKMSMIFQSFNLLAQRTALKNVCYPLELGGLSRAECEKKSVRLLELVGLGDKIHSYPAQLSGGQKQRVAIARALATDPQVLLCDEATSALDPNTTRSILELLQEINRTLGVTIIVITHEMRVVEQICNKVAVMNGGVVEENGLVKDIFLSPHSAIAKELILPKGAAVETMLGDRVIRLVFDGSSAFEPVISNLTLECQTAVNILGANTKNIDGKAVGQMLIQLPQEQTPQARVLAYLDRVKIHYEEVSSDV